LSAGGTNAETGQFLVEQEIMVGLTASDQAPLGKSAIVWFAAWHRDNPAPVLGGAVTSPQRPPRTFPGNAGPTVLRTDVLFSSPFSKLTHLAWPRNLSCSSNATFRRETDQ